jgi:hypothetical protein
MVALSKLNSIEDVINSISKMTNSEENAVFLNNYISQV